MFLEVWFQSLDAWISFLICIEDEQTRLIFKNATADILEEFLFKLRSGI